MLHKLLKALTAYVKERYSDDWNYHLYITLNQIGIPCELIDRAEQGRKTEFVQISWANHYRPIKFDVYSGQ